jgi:hypothetical protein
MVGDKVYSLGRKFNALQPNGEIWNVDYADEVVMVKYHDDIPEFVEMNFHQLRGYWDDAFFGGTYVLEDE